MLNMSNSADALPDCNSCLDMWSKNARQQTTSTMTPDGQEFCLDLSDGDADITGINNKHTLNSSTF